MEMDYDRNSYSCGEFGYITRNYKNWKRIEQGRRIEYRDNSNASNLNREENLIVLN